MKGFWTYSSQNWSCETRWVHMDFCAKIKLRMMKFLDTKHNWLL